MGKGLIVLADGREVPAVCVAALNELERDWPGATLPQARAAIAATVIKAAPPTRADLLAGTGIIIDVSELDALHEGTIIRGRNGHAYEKSLRYTMLDRPWLEAGNSSPERPDSIPLPAALLYSPDIGRSYIS